jgi:hypothetical protein
VDDVPAPCQCASSAAGAVLTERPESPAATRARGRRRADPRLLLGVLLVLCSVVVGSRVVAGAERTTAVWAVRRDLAAGTTIQADDLEQHEVRLPGGLDRYVAVADPDPAGRVLTRGVSAHELLPVAALGESGPTRREVTLDVAVGHLPPGLEHGALVEVWTTPSAESAASSGAPPAPVRVLGAAPVAGVDDEGGGLGASGATVAVVLSVDADDVAAVVAAARSGDIDLVLVPSS